ncbi:MAG: DUF2769 domain-containing protein [Methanosarcina barkeri]|nr:DUF2769 domain-containing protein [Methanosarcina sp. ERenArc_MAG2]
MSFLFRRFRDVLLQEQTSGAGEKEGCLCEACELFRKFRLEGEYFCLQAEKPEFSEKMSYTSLNRCRNSLDHETRVCVLAETERVNK